MSQQPTIDESDEGKRVVNADGDEIGIVSEVRADTAYVEPDPGITDKIRAKLGWTDADQNTYSISPSSIREITDDEVRLREEL